MALMQVSSVALFIAAYFYAKSYGNSEAAAFVAIGFLSVWMPLTVWVWIRLWEKR